MYDVQVDVSNVVGGRAGAELTIDRIPSLVHDAVPGINLDDRIDGLVPPVVTGVRFLGEGLQRIDRNDVFSRHNQPPGSHHCPKLSSLAAPSKGKGEPYFRRTRPASPRPRAARAPLGHRKTRHIRRIVLLPDSAGWERAGQRRVDRGKRHPPGQSGFID